jgi:hypothetical protein
MKMFVVKIQENSCEMYKNFQSYPKRLKRLGNMMDHLTTPGIPLLRGITEQEMKKQFPFFFTLLKVKRIFI